MLHRVVIAFALIACCVGCPGSPSDLPIWSGEPSLLRTVPNAKLFLAGVSDNPLHVVHVWGSAYDMGYAQGKILQDEIQQNVDRFMKYLDDEAASFLKFIPGFMRSVVADFGVEAALEATWFAVEKFTPQHFKDEMRGLANGAGVPYAKVIRMHMFPELIKAGCSMYGAWGNATMQVSSAPGGLVQLRALDFGIDMPIVDFPVLVVHHPTEGHPFSTLTWMGLLSGLTGFSTELGISEKVWLHYNETSSRIGYPIHFVLRDILQFDNTVDDALSRIANARRTCSVFVGVGGHQTNEFRAVEYGHEYIEVFDDKNYPLYQQHPRMDGLVYINKHTQPSKDMCMTSMMEKYYGSIDPVNTIHGILPVTQSGDLHSAIYDYKNNKMFVSVAGKPVSSAGQSGTALLPAYARPWFEFNMNEQFAEQKP